MQNIYDFPVSLVPLHIQQHGIEVPKKRAVFREDTKQTIGVVSDKYELFKHKEVVDGFRKALKGIETEETIKLSDNGAHMFLAYKFTAENVEVRKGDMVSLQLIVRNSYDGSNALKMILGAYRLVCSNGMIIGKQFMSYSQRHIGNGAGVDIPLLQGKISDLTAQFKEVAPAMVRLSKAKLDPIVGSEHLFDRKTVALPAYLLKKAEEEYVKAKDLTRWGWYNALTYAITHDSKKDNPGQAVHFGKIAWNAVSSDL